MLLLYRVLVNLALPTSNAYRIVTAIAGAFGLNCLAGRNACLGLAFQTRAPFECLVRMVNGLRFRVVASVLMFLGPTRGFVRIVVLFDVRRVLCRAGRAVGALKGRVGLLANLGCKWFNHEGRASNGGTRT